MNDLPAISLMALAEANAESEIRKLYDACYECGFFYLRDHGVEPELVQRAIQASKKFFDLPRETKNQYGHDYQKVYPESSRGYVPVFGETLNEQAGSDLKELFDLGIERPLSEKSFTGPNVLPDEHVSPDFAAAHYAVQQKIINHVTPRLVQGLALALDFEATKFDPYFTQPILIQRTIYYPPGHSGAGKHTDNGFFTILIQEELPSPSLRVYTKGEWIDVTCVENTFVVNLGDILQHFTNKRFVSTPHRVLHQLDVSRISIPFFVYPNIDAVLKSMDTGSEIAVEQIMLKNFASIWETGQGAGRARALA